LLWADLINAVDGGGQDGMVWGDGQSRGSEKQLAISRLQLAAAGEFAGRLLQMRRAESPAAGGTAVTVKTDCWKNCGRLPATGQLMSSCSGCSTLGCPAAVNRQERPQRQAGDCCDQRSWLHR